MIGVGLALPLKRRLAAGGGGGGGGTTGIVLPGGTPTVVSANSLISGGKLLFCGVDTGAQELVDVTGNFPATVVDPFSNVTTAFGTSMGYLANQGTPSGAYFDVNNNAPLAQNAQDLSGQDTGAGWTYFCMAMLLSPSDPTGNMIFGRPAFANEDPGNNHPTANMWFISDDTGLGIAALCNNDNADGLIVVGGNPAGIYAGAVNTPYMLCCTADNTSLGVATVTFYVNGTQIGQSTGITVKDSGLADDESQFSFGGIFHPFGDSTSFNCAHAAVPLGGMVERAWTPTEVASWSANPLQFLQW